MGQQQLLLVILVTILVGIATVVAINTFGTAADNANVDAVRNDLLSMASAAQAYYMKPKMMGGGGQSFSGIDFNNMGGVACEVTSGTPTECTNANGTYTITDGDQQFTMEGVPSNAGGSIEITIDPDDATMGDYTASGGSGG